MKLISQRSNLLRSFISFFCAVFLFCIPVSGHAQITWNLNFTDATGVGFNDATWGSVRQASVLSALNSLGSYLGHTATISLDVFAISESSPTVAYANSGFPGSGQSFRKTLVQSKIQSNGSIDYNGSGSDGIIGVNFGSKDFFYGDTPEANKFDLKGVIMHEVSHTLGIYSLLNASGGGSYFSEFDRFMTDASGNKLVDPTTATFNTSLLPALTGNPGVFFDGANATAANGGLVPIYSPNPVAGGSSFSHIDGSTYPYDQMMEPAVYRGALLPRQWSAIELGMMKDIGYIVVPEPSTWMFLILGMSILYFQLRQKAFLQPSVHPANKQ